MVPRGAWDWRSLDALVLVIGTGRDRGNMHHVVAKEQETMCVTFHHAESGNMGSEPASVPLGLSMRIMYALTCGVREQEMPSTSCDPAAGEC